MVGVFRECLCEEARTIKATSVKHCTSTNTTPTTNSSIDCYAFTTVDDRGVHWMRDKEIEGERRRKRDRRLWFLRVMIHTNPCDDHPKNYLIGHRDNKNQLNSTALSHLSE